MNIFWDLERLCQSIQIATLCNSLDTRFASSSWLHKGLALKRDTPLGQIYPVGRLDSQLIAALVDSCYGKIILNHAVTSILESQWISSGWSRTRTHSLRSCSVHTQEELPVMSYDHALWRLQRMFIYICIYINIYTYVLYVYISM